MKLVFDDNIKDKLDEAIYIALSGGRQIKYIEISSDELNGLKESCLNCTIRHIENHYNLKVEMYGDLAVEIKNEKESIEGIGSCQVAVETEYKYMGYKLVIV